MENSLSNFSAFIDENGDNFDFANDIFSNREKINSVFEFDINDTVKWCEENGIMNKDVPNPAFRSMSDDAEFLSFEEYKDSLLTENTELSLFDKMIASAKGDEVEKAKNPVCNIKEVENNVKPKLNGLIEKQQQMAKSNSSNPWADKTQSMSGSIKMVKPIEFAADNVNSVAAVIPPLVINNKRSNMANWWEDDVPMLTRQKLDMPDIDWDNNSKPLSVEDAMFGIAKTANYSEIVNDNFSPSINTDQAFIMPDNINR